MSLGVALFGLGRAGTIHFNGITKNRRIELLYIVEEETTKAEQAIKSNGLRAAPKVVEPAHTAQVLGDSAVDFVVVATPTHAHEKIVRAALHAGKGVFCEKPIAKSIEAVAEIYDEAKRVGRPLFCAFQRRFDPDFRSLRDRLRNGDVGTIHMIKTCSRDSPVPSMEYLRQSGGIFVDCGVHDIDMVCWLTGEKPVSVQAQAHAFNQEIAEMGDVDTVAIVIKFPSGTIAQVDLSRFSSYGYDQRIEVHGEKGMLLASNPKRTTLEYSSSAGERLDLLHYSFPQRYKEAYENELDHFVDVLLGKGELLLTKEDVVLTTKLAEACEKSYKTGKVISFDMH